MVMPHEEEAYVLILEYIQGETIVQWLSPLPNADDLSEEYTEHLESYERVVSVDCTSDSQKITSPTDQFLFADDGRPSFA